MSTPDQKPAGTTIDPPPKPSLATLKTYLTSQIHTLDEIHDFLIDSPHLSDTDVRNLVGHIRKAFLNLLWYNYRHGTSTIRSLRFGNDYERDIDDDPAITEDKTLERDFYRMMDDSLEFQGAASREEAIAMILDQVGKYRDT